MKKCSKCGTEKSKSEFSKYTGKKDGLRPECKECQSQYYKANTEKMKARSREYAKANPEKIAALGMEYRKANPVKIAEYQIEYRKANAEKLAAKRRIRQQSTNAQPA